MAALRTRARQRSRWGAWREARCLWQKAESRKSFPHHPKPHRAFRLAGSFLDGSDLVCPSSHAPWAASSLASSSRASAATRASAAPIAWTPPLVRWASALARASRLAFSTRSSISRAKLSDEDDSYLAHAATASSSASASSPALSPPAPAAASSPLPLRRRLERRPPSSSSSSSSSPPSSSSSFAALSIALAVAWAAAWAAGLGGGRGTDGSASIASWAPSATWWPISWSRKWAPSERISWYLASAPLKSAAASKACPSSNNPVHRIASRTSMSSTLSLPPPPAPPPGPPPSSSSGRFLRRYLGRT
mmetsp:Transcript_21859/g.49423  ORF Transcript_21859/g.49423 Transcript_21859/m.49423 type:complete len:306 (+) Transcript_21859:189-1106(+)